jgi:hypothetical protein
MQPDEYARPPRDQQAAEHDEAQKGQVKRKHAAGGDQIGHDATIIVGPKRRLNRCA